MAQSSSSNGVDIVTIDRATSLSDGLELFTCTDAIGQSQINAWSSWKAMPDCSVCVFGDAPGVGDHARGLGFRSIETVRRDEFGRPLLSWIFERMHDESTANVLGYINSDIVLLPGLAASVAAVRAQFDEYLVVARRWNVDSLPAMDLGSGWDEKLRSFVLREGELFTPYGIDLFVFSRGLLREIPQFALGSDYWDNYLIMRTRRRGIPVIDVTSQVMLIHLNHSLGKYRSADERRLGPEGLRGFALLGDTYAMLGRTTDATHVVAHGALKRADTEYVTVVVPHRGDTRRLCRGLRSLEYQSYPQSFLDSIVVNNDPDAPLRYLEADFPTVRVVTESRYGRAYAQKKGICCANAAVVAMFDADIVATPHCIERAMHLLKNAPESQVVVCRVDPLFLVGKTSYFGRAVEWFDAVTHYNRKDWITDAGTFVTGALIVRKEVFAKCGYLSELCPDAASEDKEWLTRVIATGIKVIFGADAVVRRETVRSLAELRRKQQQQARGECILKVLEGGGGYRLKDVFRDEWKAFRARIRHVRRSTTIPPRYRTGVMLLSLWSFVWMLRAKLDYRSEAPRVVRRRRQAMARRNNPTARAGRRGAALPFRRLGGRLSGETPSRPPR